MKEWASLCGWARMHACMANLSRRRAPRSGYPAAASYRILNSPRIVPAAKARSSAACSRQNMDAIEVRPLPGRGFGLVATRAIAAGEMVLVEEPLLLTVAEEAKLVACAHCLAWLERCTGAVGCSSCQQVAFCSPACQAQAAAKPWVHAGATCRAYAQLAQLAPGDAEARGSLRFLIQAAGLKAAAAAAGGAGNTQQPGYAALLELVGEPTPEVLSRAALLQPALCTALGADAAGPSAPLSVAETAALLVKEQLNSYGLLAPARCQGGAAAAASSSKGGGGGGGDGDDDDDGGGQRLLRGSGLYRLASRLNHECLPNVARFDALDGAAEGTWPACWPADAAGGRSSTALVLRALHGLPAGTEVVGSYFPLHWGYEERQAQAQQVYGFTCTCPRCLLESSPEWQQAQAAAGGGSSSGDWETDEEDTSGDAHMAVDEQQQQGQPQQQQAQQEALEPSYLSLFLLKYVCPVRGCYGTMAALPSDPNVCECSVCGATRSDAAFLAELEAAEQQD